MSVHPILGLLALIVCLGQAWAVDDAPLSLAGTWGFQLDQDKAGVDARWFAQDLADTIPLPGTTDTARKGDRNDKQEYGRLTRRHTWTGWAWYQRMIDIPPAWKDKRVVLTMERTRWARVWFGDADCGTGESLVAPHVHELTARAVPGRHRLTILVDNANLPPVGGSHQIAEHTQTNWNGIVGRLELAATDAVWLEQVQVHPRHEDRSFRVVATLGGAIAQAQGTMQVTVGGKTVAEPIVAGTRTTEALVPLGADAAGWDEWGPALHRVTVSIQGTAATVPFRHQRAVTAGLRAFTAKGTQFSVNGRTTFLRGKHDACVFPLTGHAPMDKESWLVQMTVAKAYGVNHYRFHSWCPPAAAFEAADELGIYLQPELPFWGSYGEQAHYDYMLREGKRILDAYGGHPSFTMMSLGNELHGSREMMGAMVAALRAHDPRHLYAQGSNNYYGSPQQVPGDDFWVTMRTRRGDAMVRGSFAHADLPLGRVQSGPADTLGDFANALTGVTIPVIGHEIGQFQVCPDFKEIPRYTGVLEARNLMRMRGLLKERGMLDQAEDFLQASGRLSAICYRADMEMAIRTRGMGGFQLLDLQDFPGQGTALVGMLNAFMESKGLITPAEWRSSCNDRVLLARLPGHTWTADLTLSCRIEIANYGRDAIAGAEVAWSLRDAQGDVRTFGRLPVIAVAQGVVADIGRLNIPLSGLPVPARYTLELAMQAGTAQVRNQYPIWVYPAAPAQPRTDDHVRVSDRLDRATRAHLTTGGVVLLAADPDLLAGRSVPGFFATDFWCWPMFRNPPGTMGLLMDPKHPALAGFPSAFHSDWQWFDITMAATPVVLDSLPAGHRPIVQVIDNFDRCHRLGLVDGFTHQGGRILLVACAAGRLTASVAGSAFLASLRAYAASDAFRPTAALPATLADNLAQTPVDLRQPGVTASASSSQADHVPGNAVDGNADTRWCADDDQANVSWQVDLGRVHTVGKGVITWERSGGYRFVMEGSTDGATWQVLHDHRTSDRASSDRAMVWEAKAVRQVRITITGLKKGQWASIREVRLFEQAP